MSRFTIAILLALTAASAWSQQPGADNLCQLTIHVRMSDGSQPGVYLQVELLSPVGTPVSMGSTNADGIVYFQVPSGVTYRVKVSGRGIEPTDTEFFILGGQISHTQNLSARRAATAAPQGLSPSISAKEMSVPAKAREEMKKGIEAFDKGDTAKARQRFENAIAIYPQYARAYENLGVIAAKSGDRIKARGLYLKALEVDDTFVPAYLQLARTEIQDKNYSEAEELLNKAMQLNPEMPSIIALLASAEFGSKNYDKALADAQRVHSLPHHEQVANIHLLAAQILEMQNRDKEAIAEYQLFLTEAPNSPQTKAVQQAITDLQAVKH